MLVARGYGAGVSPRKYGLNGTIPALTSSSVGSSAIRDADGTTVCPRVAKWSRKRRRISAVGIGSPPMGLGVMARPRRGHRGCRPGRAPRAARARARPSPPGHRQRSRGRPRSGRRARRSANRPASRPRPRARTAGPSATLGGRSARQRSPPAPSRTAGALLAPLPGPAGAARGRPVGSGGSGGGLAVGLNLPLDARGGTLGGCPSYAVGEGRHLDPVSYTHLRAHETPEHLVCRLLL